MQMDTRSLLTAVIGYLLVAVNGELSEVMDTLYIVEMILNKAGEISNCCQSLTICVASDFYLCLCCLIFTLLTSQCALTHQAISTSRHAFMWCTVCVEVVFHRYYIGIGANIFHPQRCGWERVHDVLIHCSFTLRLLTITNDSYM